MRNRKIKKIGNSYFIALAKSDIKDFGLREGDEVDIDDLNMMEEVEVLNLKRKLK